MEVPAEPGRRRGRVPIAGSSVDHEMSAELELMFPAATAEITGGVAYRWQSGATAGRFRFPPRKPARCAKRRSLTALDLMAEKAGEHEP